MITEENGLTNGYCTDCSACGHSGCCNPTDCEMLFNSPYCRQYLIELKATYTAYAKLYALIYNKREKHPDLFEQADEINDERIDAMECGLH